MSDQVESQTVTEVDSGRTLESGRRLKNVVRVIVVAARPRLKRSLPHWVLENDIVLTHHLYSHLKGRNPMLRYK